MPDLETRELKDIEIFAAGKWNGRTYTEKDLFDMVNNFNILKDEIKPYLKLGHDENQKILQSDGYPSAGWVTNLKVKGKKLIADVVGIPKKIFELIQAGGYKRISSELYLNLRDSKNNVYNKVLRAVALLGADTPAVGTLGDLVAQYGADYCIKIKADEPAFENYIFDRDEGGEIAATEQSEKGNKNNKGDNKMSEEIIKKFQEEAAEAKKKVEESEAKVKEAEAKAAESEAKAKEAEAKAEAEKKLAEEAVEAKNKLEAEKTEMKKLEKEKNIESFIKDLLKQEKITPKQAPYVTAVLNSLDEAKVLTYKEGESEKTMPIVEAFKKLMVSNTEGKLLGELSEGETSTFTKLEDAVESLMKKDTKLTYSQATKEASRLYPSLVEAPKNKE